MFSKHEHSATGRAESEQSSEDGTGFKSVLAGGQAEQCALAHTNAVIIEHRQRTFH